MISKDEVLHMAKRLRLLPTTVEKDYILGWLLMAISQQPGLKNKWVFKGGTCLKKCWMEEYRFSEDLDFTITSHNLLEDNFLIATFETIAKWLWDHIGIEIPRQSIRFERYTNVAKGTSVRGRLNYRGPLAHRTNFPGLKLDLTTDEVLCFAPVERPIYHPYTDALTPSMTIVSYTINELFAEKLRALAERTRSRDLYDVANLFRQRRYRLDQKLVKKALDEKCRFKKFSPSSIRSRLSRYSQEAIQSEWETALGHQLPDLQPSNVFWDEMPAILDWAISSQKEEGIGF